MTTPTATPLLKLRRVVWDDGSTSIDPEDYEVVDERGERIGRMYRTLAVGGGKAWRWTVYCIAVGGHPPKRLLQGVAEWNAWRQRDLEADLEDWIDLSGAV
jgi:hypothetical protein